MVTASAYIATPLIVTVNLCMGLLDIQLELVKIHMPSNRFVCRVTKGSKIISPRFCFILVLFFSYL